MAKHKGLQEEPKKPQLLVSKEEAKTKIMDRIRLGNVHAKIEIKNPKDIDQAFSRTEKWYKYNYELLNTIFTTGTIAEEYRISQVTLTSFRPTSQTEYKRFYSDIESQIACLESIVERLDLFPAPKNEPSVSEVTAKPIVSTDVFVVHGRDEGIKQTVARFLEALGINPIILHEQPNAGKTIIEKFESHAARAGFAVIIMTPDDEGKLAGSGTMKLRSRQNVILELGYFMGLLGRNKVCPLYVEGVELPSDYDGVLYVPIDKSDGWKLRLAKELRQAGYSIDMNKIV